MPDGSIPQVKITSCGLNGGPLEGKGEYPAYLACNLFTDTPSVYVGEGNFPRVMQDGRDGDEEVGYIANITDSTTIGFKYFDCHDIREISIWTRGYADGTFEVKDSMGWRGTGDIRGSIYQCMGKVYRTGYDSGWNTGALPDLSR